MTLPEAALAAAERAIRAALAGGPPGALARARRARALAAAALNPAAPLSVLAPFSHAIATCRGADHLYAPDAPAFARRARAEAWANLRELHAARRAAAHPAPEQEPAA